MANARLNDGEMTQAKRILVVEDDPAIRRGLVDALEFEGYQLYQAGNGKEGLALAIRLDCDLLLLDLVLPEKDGLEVLAEVRRVRPTLPVIILTARGDESDRVQGLRLGADDYVVKPFSVKELTARVEAVLRRSPQRPSDINRVTLPGATADLARREVCFRDGSRTELSEREVELLRYLAANAGRAISRDELLAHVWRIDPRGITTRTIDMQVARLRDKLGGNNGQEVIVTVRGKGYMWKADKVTR
jgi:DNA-binding response OmpR family regulator